MANNDEVIIYEIPPNTEKILFAEDLVNFVLYDNTPETDILFSAARYRNFVVKLFDDNIRTAVDFLNTTLALRDEQIFRRLARNNFVNIVYFSHYASVMKEKFFRRGFDPDRFLHYSVHLASLAANFYIYGIKEAPAMAVKYIVEAMCFDLSTCGTESLNIIAQKYVNISFDQIELETPDSEDRFHASEETDERQTDDDADVDNERSMERISNKDHESETENEDEGQQEEHAENPRNPWLCISNKIHVSHPAKRQLFASPPENQNSCNTASSYLTSSEYIPIAGTSKHQGTDVIHLVSFGNQSKKSVSAPQSKCCSSSESTANQYRNLKKHRTDTEFQKKQDKNCESSSKSLNNVCDKLILSKRITRPKSDSDD